MYKLLVYSSYSARSNFNYERSYDMHKFELLYSPPGEVSRGRVLPGVGLENRVGPESSFSG